MYLVNLESLVPLVTSNWGNEGFCLILTAGCGPAVRSRWTWSWCRGATW